MTDSDNDLYYGKDIDDDYIDVEGPTHDVAVEAASGTERPKQTDFDGDVVVTSLPHGDDTTHRFATEEGDGAAPSIDDKIDKEAVIENDGRSNTRTFFYPSSAPSDKQKQFKRMIRWQDGEGSSDRAMKNRAADKSRYIDTFCSYIGMSSYHMDRVQHIMDSINMRYMAHYSSQMVVLAIISIVANEDNWFIRDEDDYRRLLKDTDTSLRDISNIRQLVREKSDVL